MTTVSDVIQNATAQLREAGIETPEHDAKLLLAEAADIELRDIDKALLMGEPIDFDTARFQTMLERRAKREPLQYIVGHAPFRYLDLAVGPGVFIPRPETETVVQAGLDWMTQRGLMHPRVVDLCAGSGAIGLAVVTEVPGSQVWAVELSPRTAEWTQKNLVRTAKQYPSIASNYQLEVGDATSLATLAQLDGTVDMVITNPPYIPETDIPEQPEVRDWDPELALYGGSADGTLIPERIIERAFRLLKPGGALVMEHDISQGDRLVAYARATGFANASTGKDWTGRDRYLFAEK
ncbi:Protein-(Glutamine-N5) methyltransferase [Bifidobacterium saguini DSM 23967]|uniref:Release factor glutamine methyltransferase n=2 Tax=Bifidobacterium saguini TaxID=762210 RepID=A0A087D5Y1_9BIFI|nr:peptide chain release factor N(5)-glutamine methyltransferase [Bifidobacterium saguini]KFI90931.1 Protein-(Glutamine-N5) methyltransferase [Bifidobacterium saguini DSM 23967]QTB91424.1 peptide chain release factor N(5)-glutamine methyltransferase [Bifidobacterium saguini]